MTVKRAPGFQDQKASGFIPEIWASRWNHRFYHYTIANEITNTDYEGDIKKQGDKIIIPTVPDIQWADYAKGQMIEITGKLESDPIEMEIRRAQYFKFVDDDIDKAQRTKSLDVVSKALEVAAKQGAIRVDRKLLCDLPLHVPPCNQGCDAGAASGGFDLGCADCPLELSCGGNDCSNDAINLILDARTVLEEQNIGTDVSSTSTEGFFIIIPPWMKNLILKHPRFSDASAMGMEKSSLLSGKIGVIDDMKVMVSNLIPWYTLDSNKGPKKVWNIIAGNVMATTFASQVTKKDYDVRSEHTFGNYYRQLQVFDWMVTNPEGLALARVTKG